MAKANHVTADNNLQSRVSSLETSVANIAEGVVALSKKVDSLAETFTRSHRWDWQAIWGGLGIVLMVIGAAGTAWISPIYTQIEFGKAEWADAKREMRSLRSLSTDNRALIDKHAAVFGAKLTEVETQFDWLNDIVNMRDRNASLLTSLLWERTFDRPLPQPTMPNAGPGAVDRSRNGNGAY